jgi:hypothetical protein
MKTFLEILQKDCGGYPLRQIIDNLDDEQILECIEEYTDQWRLHPLFQKHSTLQPGTNCGGCQKFSPDSVEFPNIGLCKANTGYSYSKKDTDICDCNNFKRKK